MLIAGDVFQITLEGFSLIEPITNVFYYGASSSSTDPADPYIAVINEFVGEVVDPLIAVLNTSTRYAQVTIKNLQNMTDFATLSINKTGTLAGAALPPHLTFTAQLVRSNLLTRNGSKRFSGLVEEGLTGNTINWVAGQKTALENALAADLVSSVVGSWNLQPIIVGRFPIGSPNAGELDITRTSNVAQARLGLRTSSQNTRKQPQAY